MLSSFLRIKELRTSEGTIPQFFIMMTALTITSSPELPHSLNIIELLISRVLDWSDSLPKRPKGLIPKSAKGDLNGFARALFEPIWCC